MLTLLLLSLPVYSPPPPDSPVVPFEGTDLWDLAWSPDGRGVAVCHENGAAVVGLDNTVVPVVSGTPCMSIAFAEAGLLITVDTDRSHPTVWLWDGLVVEPAGEGQLLWAEDEERLLSTGPELVLSRHGSTVARVSLPNVTKVSATPDGFVAVAGREWVVLDRQLVISGRHSVGGEVILDAVLVGETLVAVTMDGGTTAMSLDGTVVAQLPFADQIARFPSDSRVLVGHHIYSVPQLRLLGRLPAAMFGAVAIGHGRIAAFTGNSIRFDLATPPSLDVRGASMPSAELMVQGDHLAVPEENGRVVVLHLGEGRVARTVEACSGDVGPLAGNLNATLFAACDDGVAVLEADGTSRWWPVDTGHLAFTKNLSLSPNGQTLAFSMHAELHLIDVATGHARLLAKSKWPDQGLSASYAPDGRLLMVDGPSIVWLDPRTGSQEAIPRPAQAEASDERALVAISGEYLWTAHPNGMAVRRWKDGASVAWYEEEEHGPGSVRELVPVAGGDVVALGFGISRYTAGTGRLWLRDSFPVERATYDPRRDVLWGTRDGAISRWNAANGKRIPAFPPQRGLEPQALGFAPDGRLLVANGGGLWSWAPDHTLAEQVSTRYETQHGFLPVNGGEVFVGTQGEVSFVTTEPPDPDSLALVAPAANRLVRWMDDDLEVALLVGQGASIRLTPPADRGRLALSPDGKRLALLGDQAHAVTLGAVTTWKSTEGAFKQALAWHGEALLFATSDGLFRWVPGHPQEQVTAGHLDQVVAHPGGVAITGQSDIHFLSADLEHLGSAGFDSLHGRLLSASPDGRWLATGGNGSVVRWNLATRKAEARYTVWADGLWEVRLADGTHQGRAKAAANYRDPE